MSSSHTLRVAKSASALERLLSQIEAGRIPAPDWIHLQGACRIDALSEAELDALLPRIHANVLRGFRTRPLSDGDSARRLSTWRRIASAGFHDFGTQGFTKCYASPFTEDYDYVRGYLEGGIQGIDPYKLYSAVLGTHDYGAEDFLGTPSCEKVETLIEPMAGTGEFTYHAHFRYPEHEYILFDLDAEARSSVLEKPWLEGCEPSYLIGNALDPALWRRIQQQSRGRSLSYIGKQSHNLFDARELYTLLSLGTAHVDDFILETPEPALMSDLAKVDDLTRPEMEDAGFRAALVEDPANPANSFTNELGFRFEVYDAHEQRVLFEYPRWTAWQPPTLVALARLLDLDVLYLNESVGDFIPVDAWELDSPHPDRHEPQLIDHSDAHDSVSFMLFPKAPLSSAVPDDPGRLGAPFAWFLASAGSWFGSWGMQQVMFTWLVVDVLHEAPMRVGTAQMVGNLPAVVFLLVGGALADRLERRATLILTHVAGAIAALGLVAVLVSDALSFGVVLVYAAVWGTLHAVHLPARDALLYDVGSRALTRAVPATTIVQMVGQAIGNMLVGTAAWLGGPAVLGIQSALTLAGTVPTARLPRSTPRPAADRQQPLHEIREGLRTVFASKRLGPLTMLISFNGIFFIGPYFVLVPLVVRDAYGGGVVDFSVLMMMFPLGTVTFSALLLWLRRPLHRGRLHFAGQFVGCLCLIGIAAVPPLPVVLLLSFVWGLGGGAFLNMGRALILESAPERQRARVLSVYMLALLGMAPIGTQLAGFVGEWVDPATGCLLAGLSMIVLLVASWVATPVRHFE